jgi:transposase
MATMGATQSQRTQPGGGVVPVTLDAGAREELARRYDAARAADTRLRYQIVLLADEGRAVEEIAAVVRRSRSTVWRVLQRYRAGGPDAVPPRPRPGYRGRIPAAWEAELRRVIALDPRDVGVDSATWTTALLAEYLAGATGHRFHMETVRPHLHAADYVCKRPTWTLKRKAEEQPGWEGTG